MQNLLKILIYNFIKNLIARVKPRAIIDKAHINLQLKLKHIIFSPDIYYYINKQSTIYFNQSLNYKNTKRNCIHPKKGLKTTPKIEEN